MSRNSYKARFKTILYLVLFAQLIMFIIVGTKKQGFHEDEYYSYYSSNRTAGLFVTDRSWQDTDTIKDEFVVIPGQGFNYSLVKEVQSWDVHPPLYYDILHTACSIVPRLFSKWIGIVVNMIAFVIAFFLFLRLMEFLRINDITKLLILTIWGFNPMTVSFVMFTRMYMWLTVFVIACALLHIRLLEASRAVENTIFMAAPKSLLLFWLKYILPIMLCSYLGFLTHYYYLIFFVFIGICFVFWLVARSFRFGHKYSGDDTKKADSTVVKRRIIKAFVYVASCALSLFLAIASYPASAAHIFSGYRGTEAISEFTTIADFPTRLLFFVRLMNEGVFGGSFFVVSIILLVLFIILRIKVSSEYTMLVVTGCAYFIVVSKTGLLLGEASNRYEMPVYWLFILIIITALELALYEISLRFELRKHFLLKTKEKFEFASRGIFYAFCAFMIIFGLTRCLFAEGILFLYQEEKEMIDYARDNSKEAVAILYNSASPDKVWWITSELLEYSRIYFINEENDEKISDETICNADKLIVYAADDDNQKEMLDMILDVNDKLDTYKEVGRKKNWTTFEFTVADSRD